MFEIGFDQDWHKYLKKVPLEQHKRLFKKIQELKEDKTFRHLKLGSPYFVLEVGQYRICFIEETNQRTLLFIGNHKEYEKWLGLR
jgi:mRNA-degrading endonuclease RelE of RelBE toxin-antitoxin system